MAVQSEIALFTYPKDFNQEDEIEILTNAYEIFQKLTCEKKLSITPPDETWTVLTKKIRINGS